MQWRALLALVFVAPNVNALLRFACSQLVIQRLDPIRTPNALAGHLHQIIGGDAFNVTMNPANTLDTLSTCTTCKFKEDFSNYWTAVLFFKHQDGTYERVPQMANFAVGAPNGGMTVYYIPPINNRNLKVTAFKKGFRMIAGDAMLRRDTGDIKASSLTFRCFGPNFRNPVASSPHPGMPGDTKTLPNKKCEGGIRSNIYFPTCWDGVNLDSPDHMTHVAYSTGGSGLQGSQFGIDGTCPSSHPVRLPQLFLEIVWDTRRFNNLPWPTDGSQPFVFSMGDPDGYGQHADYVFGWKGDSLQRAMDRCTDISGVPNSCRELTLQNDSEMNRCTQANRVPEKVDGALPALPGCNPIQKGPERGTQATGCGAPTTWNTLPGRPGF